MVHSRLMKVRANGEEFLIDTGASLSIIKRKNFNGLVDPNDSIEVKGVSGNLKTLGICNLNLGINQTHSIEHKFHVVPDSFQTPSAGIIGDDLLRKYKAIINYELNEIIFKINNSNIKVKCITEISNSSNSLVIPSRCEYMCRIDIESNNKTVIVLPQQLCEDVFVEGAI